MEPEKWTCCGAGMEIARLYSKGIKEGMTEEEQIEAGGYLFRDRLVVGGCLKAFSRRNALSRHVDNPNISCVRHMDLYFYQIPEMFKDLGSDKYPLPSSSFLGTVDHRIPQSRRTSSTNDIYRIPVHAPLGEDRFL